MRTGELKKLIPGEYVEGTIHISPQAQERNEKYKEMKQKEEERKFWSKRGPKFYFVSSDGQYEDLSPAAMARIIYLATYMGYDNGKLKTERGELIKKKDLQKIMCLSSKSQVSYFWREVNPKYLFEDENGGLAMNESYFQRGKLKPGDPFQKFYIEAIRELYRKTDSRRHKHLGAVFQLLPFINIEYNAVCHNPMTKDLDEISFLTLDEFCDAISYDKSNKHRLPKLYKRITFPVGDSQEVFCAFVTDGGDIGTAKIYINPRVLYKGHNLKDVRILGKFCEQK